MITKKVIITDRPCIKVLINYLIRKNKGLFKIYEIENLYVINIEIEEIEFYRYFFYYDDVMIDYLYDEQFPTVCRCNIDLGFSIPLDLCCDYIGILLNLYEILRYHLENELSVINTLGFVEDLGRHPYITNSVKSPLIEDINFATLLDFLILSYDYVEKGNTEEIHKIQSLIYDYCFVDGIYNPAVLNINKQYLESLFNLDNSKIPNN